MSSPNCLRVVSEATINHNTVLCAAWGRCNRRSGQRVCSTGRQETWPFGWFIDESRATHRLSRTHFFVLHCAPPRWGSDIGTFVWRVNKIWAKEIGNLLMESNISLFRGRKQKTRYDRFEALCLCVFIWGLAVCNRRDTAHICTQRMQAHINLHVAPREYDALGGHRHCSKSLPGFRQESACGRNCNANCSRIVLTAGHLVPAWYQGIVDTWMRDYCIVETSLTLQKLEMSNIRRCWDDILEQSILKLLLCW